MPQDEIPNPEPDSTQAPLLSTRHNNPALQREMELLRQRLVQEASTAIGMLETAVEALFTLDEALARSVVRRDDDVDAEEVAIEESCYRVLALFSPVARDFRTVAMFLKVNADLERIADHATSIAKQSIKLKGLQAGKLPTALTEMAQRVPIICQTLLQALLNTNTEAARNVVMRDTDIDRLDKQLFVECVDMMGSDRESKAIGIICYRCGRELERIGDLMVNIAEDVIYLAGGQIVRHEIKRQLKAQGKM